jgi:sec-independent protein translocase protein TatB
MFGIGWSEFVVIGVVALIAIGPKELPGVLRMVGQTVGKIRRMANEFQGQFQEAMREAEMADVRKELEHITSSATDIAAVDPVAEPDPVLPDTPAGDAAPHMPADTVAPDDSEPAAGEATPLPEPPSPVDAAAAEPEQKAG